MSTSRTDAASGSATHCRKAAPRFCAATTWPDFCREATLYNIKQCFGFMISSEALGGALARAEA
jgi:hypothetical protein